MLVILLKNVLPGAIFVHFHQEIVEFLLKRNGEGLIKVGHDTLCARFNCRL